MYLLDTNVVSELRRPRPHSGVQAWITAQPAADLCICAVTPGEIQNGVERVRDTDPAEAAEIEAWLNRFLTRVTILPLDAACFRLAAKLMNGKHAKLFADALTAATALAHGMIVATRNTKDFAIFGVPTVNPFEHS